MRSLSPDEADLWAKVAATIKPLSRHKPVPKRTEAPAQPFAAPKRASSPPSKARPVPPPAPRPGLTLDGSWDRKLGSGSIEPDRIVDLHGHNLDSAWRTIDRSLEAAINAGDRIILLITGHHRPGDTPVKRGLIRAAVHDWLVASRHASKIAAVRGAHRRHGGGGSLYLILRRR